MLYHENRAWCRQSHSRDQESFPHVFVDLIVLFDIKIEVFLLNYEHDEEIIGRTYQAPFRETF